MNAIAGGGRPKRWDPETRRALTAALRIAVAAPLRQAAFTTGARVPWDAVHELRAAFEELGIDWRALR